MLRAWRRWARGLKSNTYALYLAARDPRVPAAAKIVAAVVVAYALSPVDLIPDFIPVLGYLDDLVLLPLGIALAIRLIPADVWVACQARANEAISTRLPRHRRALLVVIGVWVAALALVGIALARWLTD